MDLGSELRTARERAGISLAELSARTRIPQRHFRAIEENDFASVPAGIFIRSFIRTYAREVGVDPVEAIAQYRSMTEPLALADKEAHGEVVEEKVPSRSFAPDLSEYRPGWGYALVALALLIVVIGVNRSGSQDQSDARTTDIAISTDAPSEASIPVATATTGSNGIQTDNGIQMEVQAQGPCWVRAVVDGQVVFARLMQPGETETLSAQQDITVRVGDPAALSYSVNGRSGEPLGAANEPVTVRFDTSGRPTRVS